MTSKRKVIAVTGTIGSGKSKAGELFAALGADVIDADQLAREVVRPGTPGLITIKEAFGAECINADGTLNRKRIAEIVFGNAELLSRLNQIIHPLVQSLFAEIVESLQKEASDHPIVYLVPLLFEANLPLARFDEIITISVDSQLAIERAMLRDNSSRDAILKRMASQLTNEEKCRRSTIVITNNGTVDELKEKITGVYPRLMRKLRG
jgi:dephospho-CoA kinase